MRSPGSLGCVVAGFKQAVTLRIRRLQGLNKERIWQRNYYEHVIRDEVELNRVRQYIHENPLTWASGRTTVRPYSYIGSRTELRIPPVRQLHHKDVVRRSAEQPIQSTSGLESANAFGIGAVLRPYQK